MLYADKIKQAFIMDFRNNNYSIFKILKSYFFHPKYNAVVMYRLSRIFRGILVSFLYKRNLQRNGVDISPYSEIGCGFKIEHPVGIVIGKRVVSGENLTLYQCVTLGQNKGFYPHIGSNVVIYPNSIICGNINIGDNVVIGANTYVDKDVPDDCNAFGNPVRIIKK